MTLNMLRQIARAEDQMMRAMMPRTNQTDTAPLTSPILPSQAERRVWRAGRASMPALTYTLAEVARG